MGMSSIISPNVSRETFWYDWAKNLTRPKTVAPLAISKIDQFLGPVLEARRRRLDGSVDLPEVISI
jgi:hypothetical protein